MLMINRVLNSSTGFRSKSYQLAENITNISNTNPISYFSTKAKANMGIPLDNLVSLLKNLAPLDIAESWDNVGLLVEPKANNDINKVLLTIDLTEDVVDEGAKLGVQLIVSYHPNIFKPMKRITLDSWKDRIVIKCIQNNIAVFSPHTTWDAVTGGVNDWLASVFQSKESKPILPNKDNETIGMGRLVTLQEPIPLKVAIEKVKAHIEIPHLRLGLARGASKDTKISTVAVCAGSGASVFANVKADLYLTGEMSHHEVLDATQNGINVILCNHSDSERGFLKRFDKVLNCDLVEFYVSQVDKDCLKTV